MWSEWKYERAWWWVALFRRLFYLTRALIDGQTVGMNDGYV